jgi:hypothetical protein
VQAQCLLDLAFSSLEPGNVAQGDGTGAYLAQPLIDLKLLLVQAQCLLDLALSGLEPGNVAHHDHSVALGTPLHREPLRQRE